MEPSHHAVYRQIHYSEEVMTLPLFILLFCLSLAAWFVREAWGEFVEGLNL